jgi:hypothetical protein
MLRTAARAASSATAAAARGGLLWRSVLGDASFHAHPIQTQTSARLPPFPRRFHTASAAAGAGEHGGDAEPVVSGYWRRRSDAAAGSRDRILTHPAAGGHKLASPPPVPADVGGANNLTELCKRAGKGEEVDIAVLRALFAKAIRQAPTMSGPAVASALLALGRLAASGIEVDKEAVRALCNAVTRAASVTGHTSRNAINTVVAPSLSGLGLLAESGVVVDQAAMRALSNAAVPHSPFAWKLGIRPTCYSGWGDWRRVGLMWTKRRCEP